MIEANDTQSNAGEPPPEAGGSDARAAAAHRGEAFEASGAARAPLASTAGSPVAADSSVAAGSFVADDSSGNASSAADADAAHDRHPGSGIEPLVLQPDFETGDRSQYHVAELLAYHDRHFVEAVYKAVLGRAPFEAERARELDELRGGRASKVEIIEDLLASAQARAAGRRVRIEGLPSPWMRRLGRMPVVGYVLRLARALVRLPVSMQHQQQFEVYALAQQQRIADHVNRMAGEFARADATTGDVRAPVVELSQQADMVEALVMFSDALLELSNSHAELQAQTQTQVEQAQAALAELAGAVTAQQQLGETFRREQQLATDALRREQQLAADAQQEFLIQEQRVIVETQRVVLEELREELRALAERQRRARDEFDAEVSRLRSLQATAARENFSGQA
jgi:hypothetical protein